MEYKKSRKNVKRVIYSAKEKKQNECANDLNDSECQNGVWIVQRDQIAGTCYESCGKDF